MPTDADYCDLFKRILEVEEVSPATEQMARELLEHHRPAPADSDAERRRGLPHTGAGHDEVATWAELMDHEVYPEKAGVYLKRFGQYAPRAHTVMPADYVDNLRTVCSLLDDRIDARRVGDVIEWLDETGESLTSLDGVGPARADAMYLYLYRIFGHGGVDIRPACNWKIPVAGDDEPETLDQLKARWDRICDRYDLHELGEEEDDDPRISEVADELSEESRERLRERYNLGVDESDGDDEGFPDKIEPPRTGMRRVEIGEEKDLRPDPPEAPDSDNEVAEDGDDGG